MANTIEDVERCIDNENDGGIDGDIFDTDSSDT